MYLKRLLEPAPDAASFAGLPSRGGMADAGRARRAILDRLLAAAPSASIPDAWRDRLTRQLPFALPLSARPTGWAASTPRLPTPASPQGATGSTWPATTLARLVQAVLIPCHHYLSGDDLGAIEGALAQ
jgi:hypothetical protein